MQKTLLDESNILIHHYKEKHINCLISTYLSNLLHLNDSLGYDN